MDGTTKAGRQHEKSSTDIPLGLNHRCWVRLCCSATSSIRLLPRFHNCLDTFTKGTIEVGGLKRTYLTYVPRGMAKEGPLVVVMHGSGENGARIRIETGYGFERLADERSFAVAYPDGNSYRNRKYPRRKVIDLRASIAVGFAL